MLDLGDVLESGLQQSEAGWNMGSFGAIAEFHHVGDEASPTQTAPLMQVTARCGMRIERLEGVRPVAYETLSPRAHRWSQAVSLCLPETEALMHRRDVLTEIGPDDAALREEDRGAVLFDMGLAQPQVDFCIRTTDAELLAVLRQNASPPCCIDKSGSCRGLPNDRRAGYGWHITRGTAHTRPAKVVACGPDTFRERSNSERLGAVRRFPSRESGNRSYG